MTIWRSRANITRRGVNKMVTAIVGSCFMGAVIFIFVWLYEDSRECKRWNEKNFDPQYAAYIKRLEKQRNLPFTARLTIPDEQNNK